MRKLLPPSHIRRSDNLSLLAHEQSSHAHTGTHTHTRHQDLLLPTPQLRETCHYLTNSRHAERVSDSDCTSAWIHIFPAECQLIAAVDRHRGESFIDLDNIYISLE